MWQAAHSEGRSVITEEHLKIASADALFAFENAVCESILHEHIALSNYS